MKKTIACLAAVLVVSAPAYAKDAIARISPNPGCGMKEQVSINVSFNQKVKNFADAKVVFDQRMQKVEEFAKQNQVKNLVLQSQNFNVSSQPDYNNGIPDGMTYQMSGNMSYMMDDANLAFKFAELLTQQKWQVNLSSNSYRQGNCSPEQVGQE